MPPLRLVREPDPSDNIDVVTGLQPFRLLSRAEHPLPIKGDLRHLKNVRGSNLGDALDVSEFAQQEMTKMGIGANDRFNQEIERTRGDADPADLNQIRERGDNSVKAGRVNPQLDHDLNRQPDLGAVRVRADRERLVANESLQATRDRGAWNAKIARDIRHRLSSVTLQLRDDLNVEIVDRLVAQ